MERMRREAFHNCRPERRSRDHPGGRQRRPQHQAAPARLLPRPGHSFVSRLISNGIDPVTVAALAGDKVETILKVYAHEYDRARRGAELRDRISAANTAAL